MSIWRMPRGSNIRSVRNAIKSGFLLAWVEIFENKEYRLCNIINEVPLSASIRTKIKMPLTFWNITGRLQWWFGSKKQKESKKETYMRAANFVNIIIEKKENCVVVTHGFFMHTLALVMKKIILY